MAGKVWAAGNNSQGVLGQGDTTERHTLTQVGSLSTWTDLAGGGGQFMLAVRGDGTLWSWGNGGAYGTGQGSTTDLTTATQVGSATTWSKVAAGGSLTGFGLGIRTDGTLWGWGGNGSYQLGLGDTTTRQTPTQIGSATTWSKVSAGGTFCHAIRTDGTLWVWGSGQYAIGLEFATSATTPTQIGSVTTWAQVSSGWLFGAAIRTDGTLWAWGDNTSYAVGLPSQTSYGSPTQIGSGTNWAKVRCSNTDRYSMAIKTDGTLWATGNNANGRCGSGNTTNLTAWTQIGTDTDWADVFPGQFTTWAVKTDGRLYAWGQNDNGQYGDGTVTTTTSPRRIGTDQNWAMVAPTHNFGAQWAMAALQTVVPASLSSSPTSLTLAWATGHSSSPTRLSMTTHGAGAWPCALALVDDLDTTRFSALVTLDGVDVTARVIAPLEVDAEEGAARVATWSMLPSPGVVDPLDWTGRPVTIDLIRLVGGVSIPSRLFTGVVDVARYDPLARRVDFECTDDLQNVVAALARADIDALTGAAYLAAVHGEIGDDWAYAQALMEARQASLDANPYGGPRVTAWAGLPVWRTFSTGEIYEDAPALTLPRRRDIVNTVYVSYEYRYYRLRERHAWLSWSASIIGVDAYARGYALPDWAAVESALTGTAWTLLSSTYGTGPRYVPLSGYLDGFWHVDNGQAAGVDNVTAHLAQRHAQTVTESYTFTVQAPASVAAHGAVGKTLRGALATTWTADAWEADLSLAPDASAGYVDQAPDAPRAVSDQAVAILLDQAKTLILASHRTARVAWTVPCLPEADLDKAAGIAHATLTASGKIVRVTHRVDTDRGEADTRITIAVSGVAAGGVVTPSALVAPTPPVPEDSLTDDEWAAALPNLQTHVGAVSGHAYSDGLMGYLVNAPDVFQIVHNAGSGIDDTDAVANPYYSDADAWAVTGWRVELPGVADDWRNPLTLPQSQSYDVDIPVDSLTTEA